MTDVLIKRGNLKTDTQGERTHVMRKAEIYRVGKDGQCQKLGKRHRTDPPSQPPEGTNPADTLSQTSGLQSCETMHSCSLCHPVCGTLLQQP